MPEQRHSQPTPICVGSSVYACSGVTCHLHFWQNDWGLLRATAVTRGWNRHQIRASTQSYIWRRKFSHHSCWNSADMQETQGKYNWPRFFLKKECSPVADIYQYSTFLCTPSNTTNFYFRLDTIYQWVMSQIMSHMHTLILLSLSLFLFQLIIQSVYPSLSLSFCFCLSLRLLLLLASLSQYVCVL